MYPVLVIRFYPHLTFIRMPAVRIHTDTVTAAAHTHTTEVSATPTRDSMAVIGADGAAMDTDVTTVLTATATVADIRIGALTGIAADMDIEVAMVTVAATLLGVADTAFGEE